MDSKTKNIDAALWYLTEKKYSVITVRGDKTPYIKWEKYQKERATEEEVKGWWKKWPNAMIGIITGKISDLAVIDIDTDEGSEEINKLIPENLEGPTVQTPKGGFHLYFKNPDAPLPNNVKGITGCDFKTEGGYVVAPPSINENNKHYSWADEFSLADVDLSPLPPAYSQALACTLNNTKNSKYKDSDDTSPKMFDYGERDNDLFTTANSLVKGGMPREKIFQVLEKLILSWGEEPDPKWINAKIDSALKRSAKREKTLVEEVEEYISSSRGVIVSSDVIHDLQLSSSREKRKNLSKILIRKCDKGELEKYGNKNGVFRIVDSTCDDIDFLSAPKESINIKWPFEIEDLVKILPKNIIVAAGEQNAGKTAFLLNVVKMNMYKHEIYYFSSEMGDIEMQLRLDKFDMPLEDWKFKAKERVSDFADVIRPDAINIIDFLEIHEDYYKIGARIKEIFDKLGKGIAIIAIQKSKEKEYGVGGMMALEKPRLYLTMESDGIDMNKIKIVKAKNWATHENPNNLEREFKLFNGCQFLEESGGWMKPYKPNAGKKQKK